MISGTNAFELALLMHPIGTVPSSFGSITLEESALRLNRYRWGYDT